MNKVFISAGDVSGDFHASHLVKALQDRIPDVVFWGIGRKKLKEVGVNVLNFADHYDVVGIDSLFGKVPSFYRLTKNVVSNIDNTSFAIFVDYPGYNIFLARYFKERGVKNVYYIAPQVWGWWSFRAKLVKRYFDLVLVIYPFEVDFWKSFGVNAIYVGNPVYDAILKNDIAAIPNLPKDKKIIGLLPGSRPSEVKRILPYLMKIKRSLEERYKNLYFLLSLVPEDINISFESNLRVVPGNGKAVMKSSDVVIVASGTATLEAALLEKPMIVLYELSPLSFLIGNIIKRVEYLSLVNIISQRRVVKEFIQRINVREVVDEVERLLFNEKEISKIKFAYKRIKKVLSGDASENAALLIKRRFLDEKDD